jgi:hypothetical protein
METLCDDDYLVEVIVRVAVKKQDSAAVIEEFPHGFDTEGTDMNEEGRVITSIVGVITESLQEHPEAFHPYQAVAHRIATVAMFEDENTIGKLPESDAGEQAIQTD